MNFFKKLFGPAQPQEPIFPGESYTLLKVNMPEGLALATVNKAYDNYPNKAFYPFFVGIELEVIEKNDNGHPLDDEAERLNQIQEDIEAFLKQKHTVHFVARVTRNGARDIMIYIDNPKLTQEEVANFCGKIQKERQIIFGIQMDSAWTAVSGFVKQ
ncbi:MAG: DUF695 domain-containing protein [Chitinophagaceae bacterium]|nr:DUF695 domain-containing protein [Chitinophagaceae bacterium]